MNRTIRWYLLIFGGILLGVVSTKSAVLLRVLFAVGVVAGAIVSCYEEYRFRAYLQKNCPELYHLVVANFMRMPFWNREFSQTSDPALRREVQRQKQFHLSFDPIFALMTIVAMFRLPLVR